MVKMHFKGWRIFVTAGPYLLQSGWYGGQFVRFTDNMIVEKATAEDVAGILINGYKLEDFDGKPYNYIDMDGKKSFIPYQYENEAVNAFGKTTIASDDGLYDFNSNVYDNEVTYQYNQKLYLNNNGLLTNIDLGFFSVGVVAGIPEDNNNWLRVLLRM